MNILKDLVVIDLSSVLAGPSVGSFLAELGARVIKFEKPGGDVTQGWKLPAEGRNDISAYYASINFGKELHTIDLRNADERDQLDTWLAEADVLIENFKRSDLERFRLRREDLAPRYPKMIHCHLQGFRKQEDRVAYDVVLQAETGFMYMNGTPESGPVKMPVALIDVLAAHQMKEAILLALYARERDGKGSYISASLEEAGLSALTNQASNYLMARHIPERMGSKHPNIAPYGDMFTCNDGRSIVLAIGSDRQMEKFATYIGATELMSDERFSTNAARVKNREELNEMLARFISGHGTSELLEWCHENQVPAGEVRRMDDVMKNPVAEDMVLEELQDHTLTKRMSALGFKIER